MRLKRGALIAEGVGTFALVLVGCGAILVEARTGALGHIGVAAAFGLVIGTMIHSVGHVSGAHFNPAVTVAFAANRRIPFSDVVPYAAAQLGGAVLGALSLRLAFGPGTDLGATAPMSSLAVVAVLGVELLITAILMFVIVASVTRPGHGIGSAAFAIGATVAMCALVAGPLTGASMNPARSFGPAIVALDTATPFWLQLAAYGAAPVAGALLGAFAFEVTTRNRPVLASTPDDDRVVPATEVFA